MNLPTAVLRWGAVSTAAAALLIGAAASAGAAEPGEASSRQTYSAVPNQADDASSAPGTYSTAYRGVQGGNLCLLSDCSVGGSSTGEQSSGPSNTQGFNLCLLSRCGVRP
ncbi:hypothetical protein ACFU96_43125 [Streptomyces sp. NPDC057620]|uniref:hypothetical protein n=1 Tax=Streptomyces sp. NPDC057620 TaxID=3346185 RepID=UPI00369AB00C